MKPILLFDIDGTLMHVKKPFIKKVIAEILYEFEIDPNPLQSNTFSFAGRTDREIFTKLVANREPELYIKVKNKYLDYMENHFSGEHTKVIDGAEDVVNFGREAGYRMGLCTGNFRESAFRKIEAAGFGNLFSFGGFGCNHTDRKHLPGEASKDFSKLHGFEPEPHQFIVIGDTPNDIRCAKHFGATSVAVSTGSYTGAELLKTNPDLLISDLRELTDWLKRKVNSF